MKALRVSGIPLWRLTWVSKGISYFGGPTDGSTYHKLNEQLFGSFGQQVAVDDPLYGREVCAEVN